MPYIKPHKAPFGAMTRLLKGYGYDGAALAKVLGCSAPTARKRISSPESLTLLELDRLNRYGHIPIEELREAITR